MITVVVFDLDGTLADTASLTNGRRVPWDVLAPGLAEPRDWIRDPRLRDLPGQLIQRGYTVFVATRAPLAYASTLVHLLGVDTQFILASAGPAQAKADRIVRLVSRGSISPDDVLYVGDIPEDETVARLARCRFAYIDDFLKDASLSQLRPLIGSSRLSIHEPEGTPKFTHGTIKGVYGPVSAGECSQMVRTAIRNGIPDPNEFVGWLDLLLQHPDLTREDRAALTYFALLTHRASGQVRRFLQHGLLSNLSSPSGRCIIRKHNLFQVDRRLITKAELRSDAQLRGRYLTGLRRVFESAQGTFTIGDASVPTRVAQTYRVGFGDILGVTKNYGGAYGTRWRSGPEVHLGNLDLVADIVASAVQGESTTPIVPVPSSPGSPKQPGEVSQRLASLVGERITRKVIPLLARSGDGFELVKTERPSEVVLLDDQITSGETVSRAMRILADHEIRVAQVVAFSANRSFLERVGAVPHGEMAGCPHLRVGRWLGLRCLCGQES